MKAYINDPNKTMAKYGADAFMALLFYAVLMKDIGYEIFPAL